MTFPLQQLSFGEDCWGSCLGSWERSKPSTFWEALSLTSSLKLILKMRQDFWSPGSGDSFLYPKSSSNNWILRDWVWGSFWILPDQKECRLTFPPMHIIWHLGKPSIKKVLKLCTFSVHPSALPHPVNAVPFAFSVKKICWLETSRLPPVVA